MDVTASFVNKIFQEGDAVHVTGMLAGDQVVVSSGAAQFDRVLIENPDLAVDGNNWSLGYFRIGSVQTGDPIKLTVGVTAVDGDGDTTSNPLNISLDPEAASSQTIAPYHDVTGGPGNDVLYGGGALDILAGNEGDDILIGGFGRDTLTGVSEPIPSSWIQAMWQISLPTTIWVKAIRLT